MKLNLGVAMRHSLDVLLFSGVAFRFERPGSGYQFNLGWLDVLLFSRVASRVEGMNSIQVGSYDCGFQQNLAVPMRSRERSRLV